MTPEEIKKQMDFHRKELQKQVSAINKLRTMCPHTFDPLTKAELDDKWMSVGAWCLGCESDFGWRCKESPDGVCHYDTCDGKVHLINDSICDPPEGHDKRRETLDSCIFCGHPEERK